MSKIWKLTGILFLVSTGLASMFYGSQVNFLWEYFKWPPFLEQPGVLLIPNAAVFYYVMSKNRKLLEENRK
jgi:hypothetical protein